MSFIAMPYRSGALALLLAAALSGPVPARAEYRELVAQFVQLRAQSVFPVQGASGDDIEETFGPRRQPSTGGTYDWHRGIDIDGAHGRTIVAACAGQFDRYTNFVSGGWTLVLKHTFPALVEYRGRTLRQFYTYYMHLEDSQTPAYVKAAQAGGEHPAVQAGQPIGVMGNSRAGPGEDYAIHLHFELRVGTASSLEYQNATWATNSPSYYGFDPHMHPLLLFEPLTNTLALTVLEPPTPGQDGLILIRALNDDQPTINRVEVTVAEPLTGTDLARHTLDLNQRIGFDASSTAELDSRDFSRPYFAPLFFTDAQTDYATQVVIPATFAGPALQAGGAWRVVVRDIWGRAVQTPAPALAVQRQGARVEIRWPLSAGPLQVEWAPSLDPPVVWTPETTPPLVGDGWFGLGLEAPGPQKWFRLREPD